MAEILKVIITNFKLIDNQLTSVEAITSTDNQLTLVEAITTTDN